MEACKYVKERRRGLYYYIKWFITVIDGGLQVCLERRKRTYLCVLCAVCGVLILTHTRVLSLRLLLHLLLPLLLPLPLPLPFRLLLPQLRGSGGAGGEGGKPNARPPPLPLRPAAA